MADEVEQTAERMEVEERLFVKEVCRQARNIPKGHPGECFYCGEEFSRVVEVINPDSGEPVDACGRCRDRRGIA